jgi:hypothetical protein
MKQKITLDMSNAVGLERWTLRLSGDPLDIIEAEDIVKHALATAGLYELDAADKRYLEDAA